VNMTVVCDSTSSVAEFRRRLLGRTITQASASSPFYGELYRGLSLDSIHDVVDLPRLPVVRRGDLVGREEEVLCRGQHPTSLQHTSGTTGAPLLLVRTAEEAQFRRQFFRADSESQTGEYAPLVMVVVEAYHGTMTEIPSSCFVVQGSVISDSTIETTLGLLQRHYRLPGVAPRISLVGGTDTAIRLLTHYGQLGGVPLGDLDLLAVQTCGDFIPRRVRHWVQDTWRAPLIDRYSCAEHFGGATSLPGTDIYRFDPYIVPEVLDPITGDPIHQGVGILTLTSLNPFVQGMPVIRYWTDDLVEIVETDDLYANLAVRIKGRMSEALADPRDGRPILTSVDVRNAIEEVSAVAYRTRRSDLHRPGVARAIGRPEYRMRSQLESDEWGKARLLVELDVGVHAGSFETAMQPAWERDVAGRVLAEAPTLTGICKRGLARLVVHARDVPVGASAAKESTGGSSVEPD
jgi:phenylacetate-coenzyme A ligase PaaK-like adenylate-forming protein